MVMIITAPVWLIFVVARVFCSNADRAVRIGPSPVSMFVVACVVFNVVLHYQVPIVYYHALIVYYHVLTVYYQVLIV